MLIADVSGKGMSAALYMAELKGLILSLSQIHQSPRDLLIEANRSISEHLDSRSFITMTYAVIDPAAGMMTYARAGHTPLMYLPARRTGRPPARRCWRRTAWCSACASTTASGSRRCWSEATLHFAPGDLLVLFTDGISEAMNEHADCFGEPRLAELLEEHGHLPFGELRERILREIEAFVGGAAAARRHDDDPAEDRRSRGTSAAQPQRRYEPTATRSSIFRTHSDIEASMVRGLLDAHGIEATCRPTCPHAVFPLTVNGLGRGADRGRRRCRPRRRRG